jgi:hypothetical protein
MFFKKKIQFHCSIPDVAQSYPITDAKNYKWNWLSESARAFKQLDNNGANGQIKTGTIKCPGIRDVCSQGYILRAWFDLNLITNHDPIEFMYAVPDSFSSFLQGQQFNKTPIKWFSGDVPQVAVPLPSNSLQTLVKITTPWTVRVPTGWSLMIMPVPYPDDPEFSCTYGLLRGSGEYEINPIIAVHRRPGQLTITAGTPLCQLIPIKNDKIEYQITSEADHNPLSDYADAHRF